MKLLLLNGPNLNLLGTREPDIYGRQSLDEIMQALREEAQHTHCELDILQSNHEGVLIDRIHQALAAEINGIIITPEAIPTPVSPCVMP
jgi:3-dehydroquinate dehydratase-2